MAKPVKPSADRVVKSGVISTPKESKKATFLKGKLIFFHQWCKKCGLCTVVCPHGAMGQDDEGLSYLKHPEKCQVCSLCWRICPDFVITKNPELDGEVEGDK